MLSKRNMICILGALLLAGCGSPAAPAPADKTPAAEEQAAVSAKTPKPAAAAAPQQNTAYAGFTRGQTLYEANDVLITLADITDEPPYVTVSLDVENKTGSTVRVNVMRGFFDGFEAPRNARGNSDVGPGEKKTLSMDFDQLYFPYYIEGEAGLIDLYLELWDLDKTNLFDKCTVSMTSGNSSGGFDPAGSMRPLGSGEHAVKLYQAGAGYLSVFYCGIPSSLPLSGLALLSPPRKIRSSFIHPNCAGRVDGDYFYVICFEETSDESHLYTAENIKINGESTELGQYGGVRSFPGKGGFWYVGIPAGLDPEEVRSLSFTISCDNQQIDEVTWTFD